MIEIGDDGEHRVAPGHRCVGAEQDRPAIGRHLQRAGQHRLARQLAAVCTLERPPIEADPDAVALAAHRPARADERLQRRRGEPVVAGAETNRQYPRRRARRAGCAADRPARRSDRQPIPRTQGRRPKPAERVGAARTEGGLDVDAATHREVAAQAVRGCAEPHDGAGGQGERDVPIRCARADGAGACDRRRAGEPNAEAAERDLERGRVVRVADQPVRQPERPTVEPARAGDTERGIARAAQILDGRQRARGEDLDHAGRNRTRVPGPSSAGGSRAASHSVASVRPSSRQPPGEARG